MMHPERVEDYLEHIASAIQRATRYVGHSGSLEALEEDEQAQDAIIRTIAVIGEAAKRISRRCWSGSALCCELTAPIEPIASPPGRDDTFGVPVRNGSQGRNRTTD